MCEPIFKFLRKDQLVVWKEQCQIAFDRIKDYLMNPQILGPSEMGKLLILYLAIEESVIGAMLAQEGEARAEHVVYYLSKKTVDTQILTVPQRFDDEGNLSVRQGKNFLGIFFGRAQNEKIPKRNPKYTKNIPKPKKSQLGPKKDQKKPKSP